MYLHQPPTIWRSAAAGESIAGRRHSAVLPLSRQYYICWWFFCSEHKSKAYNKNGITHKSKITGKKRRCERPYAGEFLCNYFGTSERPGVYTWSQRYRHLTTINNKKEEKNQKAEKANEKITNKWLRLPASEVWAAYSDIITFSLLRWDKAMLVSASA